MVSHRSRGFTYLTVLFIVAILMGGLALVGEVWDTWAKREKEADLLFVGNQYRRAIQLYVLAGKAQYPQARRAGSPCGTGCRRRAGRPLSRASPRYPRLRPPARARPSGWRR